MLLPGERTAPMTEVLMYDEKLRCADLTLSNPPQDEVDRHILSLLTTDDQGSDEGVYLKEKVLTRLLPSNVSKDQFITQINDSLRVLGAKLNLSIDRSTVSGRKDLMVLWRHLILVVVNERDDKGRLSPSFITSCRECEWFCNTLLTAGVYELEPSCGTEGENTFTDEDLSQFRSKLAQKTFLSPGPIKAILIPMCINGNHWGVMVALLRQENCWILYWGDSLKTDPSDGRWRFVIAAIELALESRFE
ncbi:hypothetical protein FGB62_324g02 [Gracilaria domingensis]|nr:hypothetical protein FGB62_324g02 [Gracilaria domingensis]